MKRSELKGWNSFASESPELAAIGRELLYQGADHASAFLATVAADRGPRVHPVFPILAGDELWLFIVNLSPKYRDLRNNGPFALHSLPTSAGGEEFHIRGRVQEISDREDRRRVVEATGGRQGTQDFEALFLCGLTSVLYTRWENWGTEAAWPEFRKWHSQPDVDD